MSDDMKSDGFRLPLKMKFSKLFIGRFNRIVVTLQIAFSWLPFSFSSVVYTILGGALRLL